MRLTVHTTIDAKKLAAVKTASAEVVRQAVYETGLRVDRLAKSNIRESGLVDTGRLRSSVHVQRPGDTYTYTARPSDEGAPSSFDGTIKTIIGPMEVVVGTNVEYAFIHEYGGIVPVTPEMRRYFWYRHYKAKRFTKRTRSTEKRQMSMDAADKWKAFALMKKRFINVRARPYLTPAYNQARSENYLTKRIERGMRGVAQ